MRRLLPRTSLLIAATLLATACGEGSPTSAPGEPSNASGGPGSIGTQPLPSNPGGGNPGGPGAPQGPGWAAASVHFVVDGTTHQSAARPTVLPDGSLSPGAWSYARAGDDGRVVVLSFQPTGGTRGDLLVLELNPRGYRYGNPLRCFTAGDGECHGRLLRGVDPARMLGPGRWWSEWHEVVGGTVELAEQAAGGVRGRFSLRAADVKKMPGSDWTGAPEITLGDGSFEVGFGAEPAVVAALRCVEGGAAGHGCADPAGLPTTSLEPGSFEAVVTGDTVATLAGTGRWTLSIYGEGFTSHLVSRHPGAFWGSTLALQHPTDGPPAPGIYPAMGGQPGSTASFGVGIGLAPLAGFGLGLAVEGGTVTITRVTGDAVEGSFDVYGGGRSYDPARPRALRIRAQGRFHLLR